MKKILIIEDDPIVSHIYRSRLEKAGFEVDVAADGQTGYYRIIETCPDALLLDLMLPRMNGIDLLKKIRSLQQFEKLPIVVFTNAFVATMIHDAFFSGASVVYNKSSVTPRQIIEVLNTSFASAANRLAQSAGSAPEILPVGAARPSIPIVSSEDDDETFESALMKTFLQNAGASVGELRKLLQSVGKASDETARSGQLEQLCSKVRALAANAGMAKLQSIATVGSATEALLKELFDKPTSATPSAMRTVASAIDLIEELAQDGTPANLASEAAFKVMVIDADAASRQNISAALEKSFLQAAAPENLNAAVATAQETEFDLILLEVSAARDFETCDRIRESGANKTTPVIFMTGAADFQLKSQSTLRSPSDLIVKPFMSMELTVKVLVMALRHHIEQPEGDSTFNRIPQSAPHNGNRLSI